MSNLFLISNDPNTKEVWHDPIGLNEKSIIFDHMGYKIGILALVDHNYIQTLMNGECFYSPSQIDVGLEISK